MTKHFNLHKFQYIFQHYYHSHDKMQRKNSIENEFLFASSSSSSSVCTFAFRLLHKHFIMYFWPLSLFFVQALHVFYSSIDRARAFCIIYHFIYEERKKKNTVHIHKYPEFQIETSTQTHIFARIHLHIQWICRFCASLYIYLCVSNVMVCEHTCPK